MLNKSVVVGIPVYDLNSKKIEKILNNINQYYENVTYVILCENRNDEDKKNINLLFEEIIKTNLWRDNKIIFATNLERLGLIKNWNKVKEISSKLGNNYKYFCWFSDHDEYSPKFIQECVGILEKNIDYVSCIPNLVRNQKQINIILNQGRDQARNNPNSLGYGNSIYGLHRTSAITNIAFSSNYLPDRIFMQQLSLRGQIVEYYSDENLYIKNVEPNSEFSFKRQKKNLFNSTEKHSYLFWRIRHLMYFKSLLNNSKNQMSIEDFKVIVKGIILKGRGRFFQIIVRLICNPIKTLNILLFGERRYDVIWSSKKDLNDFKFSEYNLFHLKSVNHIPYLGNLLVRSKNNILIFEEEFDSTNRVYLNIFKDNDVLLVLKCKYARGFLGRWINILTNSLNIILFINKHSFNSFYIKRNWSKSSLSAKILSVFMFIFKFLLTKKIVFNLTRKLVFVLLPKNDYLFSNYKIKRLFVTPGNMAGSSEVISLGLAKKNKIFSAVLILSWDNTNSKGTFALQPCKVFCWNIFHLRNLKEIHLIDEDKLFVSGPLYLEKWSNNLTVQKSQVIKKREKGFYVLFLGSSSNIYPNEINILRKIRSQLDKNSIRLELVYRPHPSSIRNVSNVKKAVERIGVVYSPIKSSIIENIVPNDEYIELLEGANLITGINTSAFIDALILKLPVHPVLIKGAIQLSSLHFKSLLQEKLIYPITLQSFSDTPSIHIKQVDGIEKYFPFLGDSSDMIMKECENKLSN
jgi:hypothetical protein